MIQDVVSYRLPLFTRIWFRGGYWLPLVTKISDPGWLPVATSYHSFGLRLFTDYHWLPNLTI